LTLPYFVTLWEEVSCKLLTKVQQGVVPQYRRDFDKLPAIYTIVSFFLESKDVTKKADDRINSWQLVKVSPVLGHYTLLDFC
jgi:hypothetical protein